MGLTLSYSSLSPTVNKDELQKNFWAIKDKFNSGLVNSDFHRYGVIALSKFEHAYQEILVTMRIGQNDLSTGWPAFGEFTPLAMAALPNGIWTAEHIAWACTDTGTGVGEFEIKYGYWHANGTFIPSVDVVLDVVMANSAANGDANSGEQAVSATCSPGVNASFLSLQSGLVDATTLAGGAKVYDDFLSVTVLLRRVPQTEDA
jgi:hypothetical protein